jgi:hypothetical protein
MRVQMMATAASPAGVLLAGEAWDLAEREALALVAGGYAVALDPRPAAAPPAPAAAEAETVDVTPSETAALRQARKARPAGRMER